MPFRIRPSSPIQDEIQRLARERIEDAHLQLGREDSEFHLGIHEARKDFKKVRAILRLVRRPLGAVYDAENQRFRDLGRSLAGTRDREAMIESFDALLEKTADELRPDLLQRTRDFLVRKQEESLADPRALADRRDSIRNELDAVLESLGGWRFPDRGFAAIEDGLRRAYRAARRSGREALGHPSPASFHEWRKRSKTHWYHMRMLADVWTGEGETRREELSRLNDVLGDHQDLELLLELADSGIPNYTRFESEHLRQLLRRRQDRLRDEAALRGAPLTAEAPRALVERVHIAWKRASGIE